METTGKMIYDSDVARINEVTAYINQNISEELSVKTLAAKFTISISTLRRYFRAYHSNSVGYYIHKCRMEKAMDLLAKRAIPVSQIGMAVGYRHRSPFTHAFTRFFGNPPAYYIRKEIVDSLNEMST
ncbi:MAG TPA: AraC family transcriptional regulator [Candidatus Babeliaceae bacterium]|nr:AraC family transcriptional regulator [Candidatus Babeliaceae bacterium]